MTGPRLIALAYSPWSLKAKWALDHHGVPYRFVNYTPMLGEPMLRARVGRWSGTISVPVLLPEGGEPIEDSAAIARWADEHGEGEPLFGERSSEVEPWVLRSDEMLAAGRAETTGRYLGAPRALAASVPGPQLIWPALVPVGYLGAVYLRAKYTRRGDVGRARGVLVEGLNALRDALDGGRFVVGEALSFADLAMAAALTVVRPPGKRYDHLDEHSRGLWGDETLAAEYEDLLAWRDGIFAEHYPGRTR